MAGVETFGEGKCPECGKTLVQKNESLSSGFMFDACPWCGFIYAEVNAHSVNDKKAWQSILEHHKVSSRTELIEKFDIKEYSTPEESEFWPSIFNHHNKICKKSKRKDLLS